MPQTFAKANKKVGIFLVQDAFWSTFMAVSHIISGGPSKDDLKMKLFNQREMKKPTVTFTVGDAKIEVLMLSVEREDGSDESYNIRGLIAGNTTVQIYYRTDKREGKFSRA